MFYINEGVPTGTIVAVVISIVLIVLVALLITRIRVVRQKRFCYDFLK